MPTINKLYEYMDSVFKEEVIAKELKERGIEVRFDYNVLEVKTQVIFSFTLDQKGEPVPIDVEGTDFYHQVFLDEDFEEFDEGEVRDELLMLTGSAIQAHVETLHREQNNADTQED